MTFAERIADQNKVSFAPGFIATIRGLAIHNNMTDDEVYSLWQKYAADCRAFDQSAILPEFCEWNKLEGYDVEAGKVMP